MLDSHRFGPHPARLLSPARRQPFAGVPAALQVLVALAVLAIAGSLAPLPALAAGTAPAGAAPDLSFFPLAHAAGPGERVKAPDLAGEAELVRFDDELIPALLQVRTGERVRIASWPVAPGVRQDVLITRHEIYAPGARVLRVDAAGTHELPRSPLVFFWGTVADEPLSGIYLALDPARGTIEALDQNATGGQHQLRPLVPGKPGLHLLATPEGFLAGQGAQPKPKWTCAEDQLPPGRAGSTAAAGSPAQLAQSPQLPQLAQDIVALSTPPISASAGSSFATATVAIDTDHEFMSLKFSDNTTNATNYIASLFAQINVMYQRDLQVQLLVGTTILRTASVADPYTQQPSNGAASSDQLSEFSNYWSANEGAVTRTVTTMLSGKSPNPDEASGIAWVAGLCDKNFGYNFSQVFLIDYLAGDASVVGHEIGHNFGSRHTHCYTPPIDECFNLEAGCWSGAESCPAPSTVNGIPNVLGTMMGYCHLLNGCTTSMVFHPRVVAVILPNVTAALGVCMTQGGGTLPAPGPITAISPNHGSTAGGTTVTISGSNFQTGDTVTIGGVPATSVNVLGPGTLTAVTGAHATGAVNVVVTGGSASSTLASAFFYAPPPTHTGFYTVTPCRVIDTRNASGPLGGPALAANQTRLFVIAGACGIPSNAVAVSANVTVVPTGSGLFSLYPGNAMPLGTSNVQFASGRVLAGSAVLTLATDGTGSIGIQNASSSVNHLLIDVNGYFK